MKESPSIVSEDTDPWWGYCDNIAFFSSFPSYSDDLRSL